MVNGLVVGLAQRIAAAQFCGARRRVTINDAKPLSELLRKAARAAGIEVVAGSHPQQLFDNTD